MPSNNQDQMTITSQQQKTCPTKRFNRLVEQDPDDIDDDVYEEII